MKSKNALLLLFLASFIWGMAFLTQKSASQVVGPYTFNSIRFLLGALVLVPFTYKSLKNHLKDKRYMISLIKASLIAALCLSLASMLQQCGISTTSAGKAGFLTSLYILIVPLLTLFIGKRAELKTWLCVASGVVGTYLLSVNEGFTIDSGDIQLILCALVFALHIMVLDHYGKLVDPVELSLFQFLFSSIYLALPMLLFEGSSLSSISPAILSILYAGIMSCGVGYTLQCVGQKYTEPAKATLALSLESFWAAVGGAVIMGERMSVRELLGCIILFISVMAAQLPLKELFKARAKKATSR